MKSYVYSFLKIFACIAFLNSWIILHAQNRPSIQKEHQDRKVEFAIQTPTAIPVLTSEEAEQANIEAFAYQESIRAAETKRNTEISQTIAHRKKHHFYKSIELFLMVIIHISFIGYINFFRRKLKIHLTNVMMFGACTLAIIMMISGTLHIMRLVASLVCLGGLTLAFLELFFTNNQWKIPPWEKIDSLILRKEYIFWGTISLFSFYYFLYNHDGNGSPDVWRAWYDQFYYMAINGKWADYDYKNYASGYAMIINGVSFYFSSLLHDYSMIIWNWGQFWFSTMMLFPLFYLINWRSIKLQGILLTAACLLYYKFNEPFESNLFSTLLALGFVLIIFGIIHAKSRKEAFCSTIVLLLSTNLFFYLLSCPFSFFVYPMDTVLGCATMGVFLSLSWEMLSFNGINRHSPLLFIPLAVLTLVKPTGVIPAVLLSFIFFLRVVFYYCFHSFIFRKKRRVLLIVGTFSISIILTPILTNTLWNIYIRLNGFQYQHSYAIDKIASEAFSQLKNGLSEKEYNKLQRLQSRTSIIVPYRVKEKTSLENKIDSLLTQAFSNHPYFDIDHSFSERTEKESHVMVMFALLLLTDLLCLILVKNKLFYLYLFLSTNISCIIIAINQFYLGPMFSKPSIPALFRYLYPGYVLALGLAFIGIFICLRNGRIIRGFTVSIFLFYSLYPHFLSHAPTGTRATELYSAGQGVLVLDNEEIIKAAYHMGFGFDHNMFSFLMNRNLFSTPHSYDYRTNLPKDLSDSTYKTPFLIAIGPQKINKNNWKYISYDGAGIYKATLNQESSKLDLTPFFCNKDAVLLLDEAYSFSDPTSWDYPPWIEKQIVNLQGKRWSATKNIDEDSNRIIIAPREEKLVLWDLAHKFCFAEDSIRFTGSYSKDMNFSLVLALYEKLGSDQQYKLIKQIPMILKTTIKNKHESEFKADLNIADIPTDILNLYYKIGIELEPGTEGTMRDFHLYQYVSGKLNLKQAFDELEQEEQTDPQENEVK